MSAAAAATPSALTRPAAGLKVSNPDELFTLTPLSSPNSDKIEAASNGMNPWGDPGFVNSSIYPHTTGRQRRKHCDGKSEGTSMTEKQQQLHSTEAVFPNCPTETSFDCSAARRLSALRSFSLQTPPSSYDLSDIFGTDRQNKEDRVVAPNSSCHSSNLGTPMQKMEKRRQSLMTSCRRRLMFNDDGKGCLLDKGNETEFTAFEGKTIDKHSAIREVIDKGHRQTEKTSTDCFERTITENSSSVLSLFDSDNNDDSDGEEELLSFPFNGVARKKPIKRPPHLYPCWSPCCSSRSSKSPSLALKSDLHQWQQSNHLDQWQQVDHQHWTQNNQEFVDLEYPFPNPANYLDIPMHHCISLSPLNTTSTDATDGTLLSNAIQSISEVVVTTNHQINGNDERVVVTQQQRSPRLDLWDDPGTPTMSNLMNPLQLAAPEGSSCRSSAAGYRNSLSSSSMSMMTPRAAGSPVIDILRHGTKPTAEAGPKDAAKYPVPLIAPPQYKDISSSSFTPNAPVAPPYKGRNTTTVSPSLLAEEKTNNGAPPLSPPAFPNNAWTTFNERNFVAELNPQQQNKGLLGSYYSDYFNSPKRQQSMAECLEAHPLAKPSATVSKNKATTTTFSKTSEHPESLGSKVTDSRKTTTAGTSATGIGGHPAANRANVPPPRSSTERKPPIEALDKVMHLLSHDMYKPSYQGVSRIYNYNKTVSSDSSSSSLMTGARSSGYAYDMTTKPFSKKRHQQQQHMRQSPPAPNPNHNQPQQEQRRLVCSLFSLAEKFSSANNGATTDSLFPISSTSDSSGSQETEEQTNKVEAVPSLEAIVTDDSMIYDYNPFQSPIHSMDTKTCITCTGTEWFHQEKRMGEESGSSALQCNSNNPYLGFQKLKDGNNNYRYQPEVTTFPLGSAGGVGGEQQYSAASSSSDEKGGREESNECAEERKASATTGGSPAQLFPCGSSSSFVKETKKPEHGIGVVGFGEATEVVDEAVLSKGSITTTTTAASAVQSLLQAQKKFAAIPPAIPDYSQFLLNKRTKPFPHKATARPAAGKPNLPSAYLPFRPPPLRGYRDDRSSVFRQSVQQKQFGPFPRDAASRDVVGFSKPYRARPHIGGRDFLINNSLTKNRITTNSFAFNDPYQQLHSLNDNSLTTREKDEAVTTGDAAAGGEPASRRKKPRTLLLKPLRHIQSNSRSSLHLPTPTKDHSGNNIEGKAEEPPPAVEDIWRLQWRPRVHTGEISVLESELVSRKAIGDLREIIVLSTSTSATAGKRKKTGNGETDNRLPSIFSIISPTKNMLLLDDVGEQEEGLEHLVGAPCDDSVLLVDSPCAALESLIQEEDIEGSSAGVFPHCVSTRETMDKKKSEIEANNNTVEGQSKTRATKRGQPTDKKETNASEIVEKATTATPYLLLNEQQRQDPPHVLAMTTNDRVVVTSTAAGGGTTLEDKDDTNNWNNVRYCQTDYCACYSDKTDCDFSAMYEEGFSIGGDVRDELNSDNTLFTNDVVFAEKGKVKSPRLFEQVANQGDVLKRGNMKNRVPSLPRSASLGSLLGQHCRACGLQESPCNSCKKNKEVVNDDATKGQQSMSQGQQFLSQAQSLSQGRSSDRCSSPICAILECPIPDAERFFSFLDAAAESSL